MVLGFLVYVNELSYVPTLKEEMRANSGNIFYFGWGEPIYLFFIFFFRVVLFQLLNIHTFFFSNSIQFF